jgi:class 3 adenylate cyclase
VTTLLDSGNEQGIATTMAAPIALVFTDMVGSSAAKRGAALGSDVSTRDRAYLESIQAKYLRLIRRAIAEHNGKEIMTIGDSFFLAFEDPVDAIRCCAAIQQRLCAEPIATPSGPMRLRIGIHVGTPEYFENSWHGIDVDIAARVQSAGSPGQIIVTEAAALKAIGDIPHITFRPLGTFALKGVGDLRLWDADYDRNKPRQPAIESIEQRRRKRIASKAAFLLAIIALASGAAWRWREDRVTSVLASATKQSITMADFENRTGDPVFDHTITDVFTAELEQSPVLKLVSHEHLRQNMEYLGRPSDQPITPDLIRETGIREGIKAYLTESIAKIGDTYVVTVSAKDISTGDDIVTEQEKTDDENHVLDIVDKVAIAMRRHLGGSLTSVHKLDAPLGEAAPPSWRLSRVRPL